MKIIGYIMLTIGVFFIGTCLKPVFLAFGAYVLVVTGIILIGL